MDERNVTFTRIKLCLDIRQLLSQHFAMRAERSIQVLLAMPGVHFGMDIFQSETSGLPIERAGFGRSQPTLAKGFRAAVHVGDICDWMFLDKNKVRFGHHRLFG
jgi:hypothetical protein